MRLSSADEDKVIRPHRHPPNSSVARRGSRSAQVERSLGWFGRWRRLSKDYEALPEVSEAMVTLAAIRLMLHRLAHPNRRRLPAS
jgi:transposase